MQVLIPKPYEPLSHQVAAAKFLVSHPAAGVFMDVGWGKTTAALSALRVLHQKKLVRRTLVITKKRICELVWPRQPKEWTQFRYMSVVFLHGKDRNKLVQQEHHIYCINPEGFGWLVDNGWLDDDRFDLLIVDESTIYKHSNTQRFKLLKNNLDKFKRRWIMTGEPAPNGLIDLFGQIYILDFGAALGEYVTRYRNNFFYPSGYGGYTWELQAGAEERIYARLDGLVCRPLADPRLKLPKVVFNTVKFELSDEAREVYSELEKKMRVMIEGTKIIAKNGAVVTGQCRQMTGGAIYKNVRTNKTEWLWLHDEKLNLLAELVDELAGKPLLVFYEFDHERQRIIERFKHIAVEFSDKNLLEVERRWNNGEITMLPVHPGSFGRGLNLQKACSHACWFTMPWDLELYKQGNGRLARQGAARGRVTIHHLVAEDTIDEYVAGVLISKERTQNALKKALETMFSKRGER